MKNGRTKTVILLAVVISLTAFFYSKIPVRTVYPPLFSKTFPLSTPAAFWASTMGMRRLAADIVWIQSLQYYGEREGEHSAEIHGDIPPQEDKTPYPQLKEHWQQIIRLDPLFVSAYLIGPTTLGWNLKRYDEALHLLSEGITAIENISEMLKGTEILHTDETHPLILGRGPYLEELKWKLYTLKATLVYLHNEEFEKAMPLLEQIALRDDTPEVIKVMLAQIYKTNKLYKKSLLLWKDIYEITRDKKRRESARNHIEELLKIISSQPSLLEDL